MSVGELWVGHPLFPYLVIILASWVLCSTIVIVRNWVLIFRLKRHNKLLQDMVVEGISGISKRVKKIEENPDWSGSDTGQGFLKEADSSESQNEESARIPDTTSEPAPTEEVRANGDHVATTGEEKTQRAESRSSQETCQT